MRLSELVDFWNSRLLSHWTTWVLCTIAGICGGLHMANARALDRAAAGLPPKDTWILDFNVGGIVQVLIVLIAAWFLSAFVDEFPVWPRQSLLLAVYLLIVGAGYFI